MSLILRPGPVAALCLLVCTAAVMRGNPAYAGNDDAAGSLTVCARAFNAGDFDKALDACNATLAADPQNAVAYFIKGSVLIAKATVDAKGNPIYPPGTREALQRYIDLEPNGAHSADAREMLRYIDTGK